MLNYRNVEEVRAYQLGEPERVVTRDGVRDAGVGEWVVYGAEGAFLMSDDAFQRRFSEYGNGDITAVDDAVEDPAFGPTGKTVDVVLEYFKGATVEEIERVKELERNGGKRSTILNYSA